MLRSTMIADEDGSHLGYSFVDLPRLGLGLRAQERALLLLLVCRSSPRKQRVGEERRLHAQFPKDLGDRKEHAEMVNVLLFNFCEFLLLVVEAASHDSSRICG